MPRPVPNTPHRHGTAESISPLPPVPTYILQSTQQASSRPCCAAQLCGAACPVAGPCLAETLSAGLPLDSIPLSRHPGLRCGRLPDDESR